MTRTNPEEDVGFLLARGLRRFNEHLMDRFAAAGFSDIRPSYGSVLIPLFAEDGLRLSDLARRSGLSKQAITGMVKLCEEDALVVRERDPDDGRAYRLHLSARGRAFRHVAEKVLANLDKELVRLLGQNDHAALKRALKGMSEL